MTLLDGMSLPGANPVAPGHRAAAVAARSSTERSRWLAHSRAASPGARASACPPPLPLIIPSYSVSKAAAFSLTQSLRALLAGHGVRVHAVLPGPVDTDMTRGSGIPVKASPELVALAIFNAVDNGEEEIFPDPISAPIADSWRDSAAKALERQLAQVTPVSS